ncbi:hypothetical protein SAMN05192583_1346 [Sphingomonas gellani]|uniref:Uncharacterized protein n=1 Tax=Sphingomonas gellani TaxID=1166340 RepID=A0A1H8BFL3_9SPHN|nr:hypothetical protein [Sphingomonas gellani]SEM81592.1 hypothetical protein SAMN05192583_1346 [Sphingomonas gellani]
MNAIAPIAHGSVPSPPDPALHPDHLASEAAVAAAASYRRQRHDGWTADRQRIFLESIADGHSTEGACRLAGMSPSSAYAFRRRAAGAAFALGWRAASLIARDHVADAMLARAIDGQTETITRANGDVIERHRFDNRLASTMLARLDRMAEATDTGSAAANASARLVAQEFDGFLDLIDRDAGPARAGLFVAARDPALLGAGMEAADLSPVLALARADRYLRAHAGAAAEVDTADLDPDARHDWTADQWTRAEAAGLVALAPPAPHVTDPDDDAFSSPLSPLHRDDDDLDDDEVADDADYEDDDGEGEDEGEGDGEGDGYDDHGPYDHAPYDHAPAPDPDLFDPEGGEPVWFDEERECWMTDFAPPADYDGLEEGRYGAPDYMRELTEEEEAVVHPLRTAALARERQASDAARTTWFATRATTARAAHSPCAEPIPSALPAAVPNPAKTTRATHSPCAEPVPSAQPAAVPKPAKTTRATHSPCAEPVPSAQPDAVPNPATATCATHSPRAEPVPSASPTILPNRAPTAHAAHSRCADPIPSAKPDAVPNPATATCAIHSACAGSVPSAQPTTPNAAPITPTPPLPATPTLTTTPFDPQHSSTPADTAPSRSPASVSTEPAPAHRRTASTLTPQPSATDETAAPGAVAAPSTAQFDARPSATHETTAPRAGAMPSAAHSDAQPSAAPLETPPATASRVAGIFAPACASLPVDGYHDLVPDAGLWRNGEPPPRAGGGIGD